jgi:hypothetical protein
MRWSTDGRRRAEVEYVLATALRLATPLLMLRWPLPGLLLAIFVDVYDWNLIDVQTPEHNQFYQNWDRIMDVWFYVIAVLMVRKWQDVRSRNIAFAFFGFRMIGQILFFITQERKFLFFFPNFFDNFLVMYLGYVFIFKRTQFIESALDTVVVFTSLMIPKIIHEYFLHFLELQPWETSDVGGFLGLAGTTSYLINYFFWGAVFYVLPFLAVFVYFRWKLRNVVSIPSGAA